MEELFGAGINPETAGKYIKSYCKAILVITAWLQIFW